MKTVTEFPSHLMTRGLEAKTALVAQGKSPEEIQASLGETFKFEGDRLKHFFHAIDVASENPGLSRMRVVTIDEGEQAPPKSVAVEAHHYVPEFLVLAQPRQEDRNAKGRFGNRGGGRRGR